MTNSKLQLVVYAFTLLFSVTILPTCGDDGSSSKDARGVFGDMADALTRAQDDYLTANADIFASADSMRPFIASILELSTVSAVSAVAPNSCLIEGVGGRSYSFNGESYVGVIDLQVQDYTARFHLYQLSAAGQPQLDHQIGYVDYTCADVGVALTEIQVFSESTLVLSSTYSAGSGNVAGTLRSPDGDTSLIYLGAFSEEQVLYIRFGVTNELQSSFSFPTSMSDSRRLEAEFGSAPAATWGLRISMIVDEAGVVSDSGYALYYPTGQSLDYDIASCIGSGTLDFPVFANPSNTCFSGAEPMSISRAQLDAISDSYQSLRALWTRAAVLVEICRSLVPE